MTDHSQLGGLTSHGLWEPSQLPPLQKDTHLHFAAETPEFPSRKGSGGWGLLEVCLKAILAERQAFDLGVFLGSPGRDCRPWRFSCPLLPCPLTKGKMLSNALV